MLINLNEEKEEDVVDDKEKEEVNSATYVLFLFECLSCVCLILIIIIFFSFLFVCVCVFILSVRFKSVNSAHFYYTLIVVTGVETDILRNQTWYAVSQWLNE